MPVGITHSSYRPLDDQYERNGLKNLDSFFRIFKCAFASGYAAHL